MDWTAHEKAKYEAIWQRLEYRERSPGQRLVPRFLEMTGTDKKPLTMGSVIDYGCGMGRAAADLARAGFFSVGVDIAANALEERIPFVEACLWDLPETLGPSTFAFCADVMEHIPEPYICNVLQLIRMRTLALGCFAISWGDDDCGRLIGQELHLTKRPYEWWVEQFAATGWEITYHEPGDRPHKEVILAHPYKET